MKIGQTVTVKPRGRSEVTGKIEAIEDYEDFVMIVVDGKAYDSSIVFPVKTWEEKELESLDAFIARKDKDYWEIESKLKRIEMSMPDSAKTDRKLACEFAHRWDILRGIQREMER